MTKGKIYEFDAKALSQIGQNYARRVQACLRVFGVDYGHLQNFPELITERKIAAYYLVKNKVNERVIITTLNVSSWMLIKWVDSIEKSMHEDPKMIEIFDRIEYEYQSLTQKTA